MAGWEAVPAAQTQAVRPSIARGNDPMCLFAGLPDRSPSVMAISRQKTAIIRLCKRMGFFFRSSTKFGPFRLNFSRSGVGASVGVKGLRLTMASSGTTYVTVGSNGFYYRETLSNGSRSRQPIASPPRPTDHPCHTRGETISTAPSSELIDSSSARLIQQLNERANMLNLSWIWYLLAAWALGGLAVIPPVAHLPNVPEFHLPSAERIANTVNDYPPLVARYGEPNTIQLMIVATALPIPVNVAHYEAAKLNVTFAPVGCVDQYSRVMILKSEGVTPRQLRAELRSLPRCTTSSNSGWTIVGYADSDTGAALSGSEATARLDSMVE